MSGRSKFSSHHAGSYSILLAHSFSTISWLSRSLFSFQPTTTAKLIIPTFVQLDLLGASSLCLSLYHASNNILVPFFTPRIRIGRRHQRRNPCDKHSVARFQQSISQTASTFAFAKHLLNIRYKPWFTFGLLPRPPSTLSPQSWPRGNQAVKRAMEYLVELCVERATCAQSQAPVVRVSLSDLPPHDEMLIGVLLQNTANAVWEHIVSVAATSDIPTLSTPACQHPYAKARTTS